MRDSNNPAGAPVPIGLTNFGSVLYGKRGAYSAIQLDTVVIMNPEHLMNASRLIAKTNLTEKVCAVRVTWDSDASKLAVAYYVDGPPSEDEEAECELTMGELLAQFTDVVTADTQCIDCTAEQIDVSQLSGLVYLRDGKPGA